MDAVLLGITCIPIAVLAVAASFFMRNRFDYGYVKYYEPPTLEDLELLNMRGERGRVSAVAQQSAIMSVQPSANDAYYFRAPGSTNATAELS